ncbi:MAG TPA: cytochrome d ubiquinol oxidase subunit II [Dissulfurispiraceae bacterium]|nr:cytochrome d ubiquinol oxidase subunit II [Dissulfurispiraceae bacterium]
MEFQIIWFILWAVLWAVYFMLDGFDLGVGILHRYIGRNEDERGAILSSIGPVWDGNEVWLLTAGGATFAAFPTTYALMFSYLYTALLLILFSLIVRGVSLELRGKEESATWRRNWGYALVTSSFLPALLFGVAFGNIFQGLPMDADGYHGNLLTLLNPYGLLTGIFFLFLFLMHGALWIGFRTKGYVSDQASRLANKIWYPLLLIAVAFLVMTKFATKLYLNFINTPIFFIVPLIAVAALLTMKVCLAKQSSIQAFAASCVTILMVTFTGVIGLFPSLIPSSIDPRYSLTIFNSSSSPYTLKIMTIVALIFVPIVIVYQSWNYIIFNKKIDHEDKKQGSKY